MQDAARTPDGSFRIVDCFLRRILITSLVLSLSLLILAGSFSVDRMVDGTGTLGPARHESVRSRLAGLIDTVAVQDGQAVEAGTFLFRIDVRDERERLAATEKEIRIQALEVERARESCGTRRAEIVQEGAVREAQLALDSLQVEQQLRAWDAERRSSGRETLPVPFSLRMARAAAAVSFRTLEQSRFRLGEISAMESELEQQELKLAQLRETAAALRERIGLAEVCAPVSGRVVAADLDRKVGTSVERGQAVLEVAAPGEWIMNSFVSDKELPFIREHQPAKILIDAFPYMKYRIYRGTVIRYSAQPVPQAERNLYRVEVGVDDARLLDRLGPDIRLNGLKGRVRFIIERRRVLAWLWDYLRQKSEGLRIPAAVA